jgi:hypothetical protein
MANYNADLINAVLLDLDGAGLVITDDEPIAKYLTDIPPLQILNTNSLKDTLHYTSAEVANTSSHVKVAHGVLVGVMGAFMALGLDFEQAVELTCAYLPPATNFNRDSVPLAWMDSFFKRIYAKYE